MTLNLTFTSTNPFVFSSDAPKRLDIYPVCYSADRVTGSQGPAPHPRARQE